MANSAEPDQLASSEPTDLDLHCLQRQGIYSSAGQGLIFTALCANSADDKLVVFFLFSPENRI